MTSEPHSRHEAAPPVERNYPRRVPGTHFDSQQQAPTTEEAPPQVAPEPSPPASRQSVFDDAGSNPNPMLPGSTIAPGLPAGGAPSLPESNPAAPPAVAEPVSTGPNNSDITALRSAQLRANRQQRQGRLFGRSLLAFVVIGGVLGAGLVFGRSLLFPTEWDPQLTPIVNELQDETGVEFDGTVPAVLLSAEDYDARLGAVALGEGWTVRVPQWRALGLATGLVDAASVGVPLAQSTTAFYDPSTGTIYQTEGVTASEDDLRLALTQALDDQQAGSGDEQNEASADASDEASDEAAEASADVADIEPVVVPVEAPVVEVVGFTGVSPLSSIATRAVDRLIVSGGVTQRQPASETLPIPIAYEVAAIDILGRPILAAAGVDVSTLEIGTPYPPSVTAALGDVPVETASALLQPGEVSIVGPTALGSDDWSLVWSVVLPQATVAELTDQVVADSYRAIERDGRVCVVAVFQTADDPSGANVLAAMTTWAVNAPPGTNAVATSLTSTRIQLETCDPGTDAGFTPNAGAVDALLDRQQLRLTN